MGEKSVVEKSMGVKSVGDKSMGEMRNRTGNMRIQRIQDMDRYGGFHSHGGTPK